MKTVLLVGAAVISEGKILLLKRLETKRFLPGYYDVPGGKVEEGEDPNLAVLRELKEETGLEARAISPYNVWSAPNVRNGEDEFIIEIDYLVKMDNIPKIVLSPNEHSEYLWVDRNGIPEKMTPELKSSVIKALDYYKKG